jgi:hypothetical protein
MAMSRVILGFLSFLTVFLALCTSARADGEAWVWYDHHIRIVPAATRSPAVSLRVMTDLRANQRSDGLDMLFFRVGSIVEIAPWLTLAAHFSSVADRAADGGAAAQYRPEVDVVLATRLGALAISDRNRFEALLGAPDGLLRYRNMLRLDCLLPVPVNPFIFNEILVRHRGRAFQENRAAAGVRWRFSSGPSLDLAYMLRSRLGPPETEHDHIILLSVVITTDLTERHDERH